MNKFMGIGRGLLGFAGMGAMAWVVWLGAGVAWNGGTADHVALGLILLDCVLAAGRWLWKE